MVEAQTFRTDLFYRLNVFPVHVPPLRERPDDIPLLVRYFAQQCARRMRKTIETIPADTMQALIQYPWPGNIRELQNIIERAVILSPGPVLQVPRTDLTPRATDTVPLKQALVQLNGDIFLFYNKSLGDLNVEKFTHQHPRRVDGVDDVWHAYLHSPRHLYDEGIGRKLD